MLIDPNGETPSIGSNVVFDGKAASQGLGAQNYVANPLPGRWRFVVVVLNPVTGNGLRQNFRGIVTFDKVKVSASPAVPNSAAVTLPAGQPVAITVSVHEHGRRPAAPAGRRPPERPDRPAAGAGVRRPNRPAAGQRGRPVGPARLPRAARHESASATATSTSPVQIEWSSPGFGIDLFGDLRQAQAGNTVSTATVTERTGTVGHGFWGAYPQQIGPFSNAGAPKGTSYIVATAVTQPFDPAVTSSTGDPFLNAVAPTAGLGTRR